MPDWGEWADKGINVIDSGIDTAKEKVGEGVDWATDKVGDGLDKVGAHDWADSVEDWGDETASSLGAEVGEQQLGQTEEANELIHGNPGKIAATVKNLRDFQKAFDLVGGGRRSSTPAAGRARRPAPSGRSSRPCRPTGCTRRHLRGCGEGAGDVLQGSHERAGEGQGGDRPLQGGQRVLQDGGRHLQQEGRRLQRGPQQRQPAGPPEPFSDPGVAKRERAHAILKEARRHRNESADTAKSAVTAAMAHAPQEPTGRRKLTLELRTTAWARVSNWPTSAAASSRARQAW